MRWPIQTQLLAALLVVAGLGILLASAAAAGAAARATRRQQQQQLSRVVSALVDANFPLTDDVLARMRDMTGAEFAVLSAAGAVERSTLPENAEQLNQLHQLPQDVGLEAAAERPTWQIGEAEYLAARLPLQNLVGPPRSLAVLYPVNLWWKEGRELVMAPLAAGAAAATVALLAAYLMAKRFVRPIQRLGRQTEAIAAGDFSPLELGRRDDELRDLAVAINRMTEQLGAYELEVRRSERLRTLGQLGAGMAHQLRNWITGAQMATELHQRECSLGERCESLQVALRQMKLMTSYLQRFLRLGKPAEGPRGPLELDELVEEMLSLVRPGCDHARLELRFDRPAEPVWIDGDADGLRQLLINLLLNAQQAASGARRGDDFVQVSLERQGGNRVRLIIADTGPGPAEHVRQRLFEPFVSDKADGSGLGLCVARQVAEQHSGRIDWEHREGVTRFTVELPTLAEAPTAASLRS